MQALRLLSRQVLFQFVQHEEARRLIPTASDIQVERWDGISLTSRFTEELGQRYYFVLIDASNLPNPYLHAGTPNNPSRSSNER